MGFYSFYKIIKDMLRTLFGKNFIKILIIVIILFGFISIYNKCFAYDLETGFFNNNVSFDIPSQYNNYNYIIIFGKRTGRTDVELTILFTSEDEFYYTTGSSGSYGTRKFNALIPANTYFSTSTYSAFNQNATSSSVQTQVNNLFEYCANHYSLRTSSSSQTFINADNQQIFSNIKVYKDNEIVYNPYTPPTLGNTQTELENLSFDNFIINANSFTQDMIDDPDSPLVMLIYNRSLSSGNVENLYPIKEKQFWKASIYFDSENSTDTNYVFSYPIFKTGVLFNVGSTYEIRLAKRVYIEEYDTWGYDYFENTYTFTISSNVTQDYINQLNQQTATSTDEDNQEQTLTAIENQTQSIDNINNTLTDSSVDSSSIDLPTDNTNDPTQSAIDNIFQTIYNSFTSGTAQDIVFPIPFTGKSITLQANYIYNMLNNNGASWVITIIQAFWWYLISRFIITDIMKKIRKIKQGNFENIQDTNIKEDML